MREVSAYITIDILITKLYGYFSVFISFDGVDSLRVTTNNVCWEAVEHLVVNAQALEANWI